MSESGSSEEKERETRPRPKGLWETLRTRLAEKGVYVGVIKNEDLDKLGLGPWGLDDLDIEVEVGEDGPDFKVVCVAPDLKSSAEEMSATSRDHVVMVRVDEETRDRLDDWVRTGAVKSRSEAAALFIREGLAVRTDELEQLRDALRQVEEAQEVLRRKASQVFSGRAGESGSREGGAAGDGEESTEQN